MKREIKMSQVKLILLGVLLMTSMSTQAMFTQIISTSSNRDMANLSISDEFMLNVYHSTENANPNLSGLKLTLFYDDLALELLSVDDMLTQGNISGNAVTLNTDGQNLDKDSNTNQRFSFTWLDFASAWLDNSLTKLYQVTFKVKKSGSSKLNFNGETTTGYRLQAQAVVLEAF